VDRLDQSLAGIHRKVVVLEANTTHIKDSVGNLAVDMRDMRKSIEQKFESLDRKFDSMHQELRGLTRFKVGVVISFFMTLIGFGAAILGVMAKGLHRLN